MALSHDNYDFEDPAHGPVLTGAPPELPIAVGQFFGVLGESHIVGEPWGREIVCDITLQGYEEKNALDAAREAIEEQIGQLTGDLTETHGEEETTWPQCTFLGFFATSDPFYDGSGQNGWIQFGRLVWRQRRRA